MTHRSLFASSLFLVSILGACADLEGPQDPVEPAGIEARVEQPLANVIGPGSTIVAELASPGGSVVAFVRDPAGDIITLEHGLAGSHPVSHIAELADATPLELFHAIAPDRDAPPEITAQHDRMIAAGHVSAVPAGFDVAEVPHFTDRSRFYSSCTDTAAWRAADNGKPGGANCKTGATCLTNRATNMMGCEPGGGCYLTNWHDRSRWSTCNLGTGTYRAFLNTFPGDGTYVSVFDVDTSAAGSYYYATRNVPGNNDRWSMGKWNEGGVASGPSGHFSLWAD